MLIKKKNYINMNVHLLIKTLHVVYKENILSIDRNIFLHLKKNLLQGSSYYIPRFQQFPYSKRCSSNNRSKMKDQNHV